jgi:hypothetical protein
MTNPALLVLDASQWTRWETPYDPNQANGWLTVILRWDHEAPVTLARLRWFIATGAHAADYDVETSLDGVTWTRFCATCQAIRAAGGASWTTRDVTVGVEARQVRFFFRNGTRTAVPRLGSLGTVEVYAAR